ncbi:phospholipase D p2 [Rhypophila sp. PSN 637]
MNASSSFVHDFLRRLQDSNRPTVKSGQSSHNHNNASTCNRGYEDVVLSSSTPHSFQLGTGASIFTNTIIPAIISAKSELIFVTCFWAPSKSLSALHDTLSKLAAHRHSFTGLPVLKIRICLSSRSLFQKLLHPQTRDGYVYPPSTWQKDFGLPSPDLLKAGNIDLQVKSLFFLPFSVMHPKFVIIDRQRAFVPSCNVSWEAWLEGCVEVSGDAVQQLLSFYSQTWDGDLDTKETLNLQGTAECGRLDVREAGLPLVTSSAHLAAVIPAGTQDLPTLVLPSQYHRNPRFRPFPWQRPGTPPPTPLNIALLELVDQARETIYIQTPNLTCVPVITALLDALQRGVDVTIITSRNMMLFEQLVTAGTTTSWCIRSLLRRYNKLAARCARHANDIEAGGRDLGQLRISYFGQRRVAGAADQRGGSLRVTGRNEEEPVHSHLKLTIVDGEYTVLGSGNMDRASWYTSQELGILFHDEKFAVAVRATVEKVLDGRLDAVFDSAEQ